MLLFILLSCKYLPACCRKQAVRLVDGVSPALTVDHYYSSAIIYNTHTHWYRSLARYRGM